MRNKALGLTSKSRRDLLQYGLLILPALLIYVMFHIIPIARDVGIAMTDALSVGSKSQFIGLRNFRVLLFENGPLSETFKTSFGWTFIFWFGNWFLNIALGLGFALMFFEELRFKRFFLIVIFMPYVVSNLAIGYIIRMLLDPSNGALNWMIHYFGFSSEPIILLKEGLSASITLILVTGWKFAGFNMVLFLAGLVVIPVDTLESAVVAGCNYTQKLIHVMIPQMWPTIIAVSVLCLTGTWQLFALPIALAGTAEGSIKSLDTLAVVFYRWAFGREGFGMASAMMVIVALFLLAGSILSQFFIKKTTVEY